MSMSISELCKVLKENLENLLCLAGGADFMNSHAGNEVKWKKHKALNQSEVQHFNLMDNQYRENSGERMHTEPQNVKESSIYQTRRKEIQEDRSLEVEEKKKSLSPIRTQFQASSSMVFSKQESLRRITANPSIHTTRNSQNLGPLTASQSYDNLYGPELTGLGNFNHSTANMDILGSSNNMTMS